jgi:hypothetical protein
VTLPELTRVPAGVILAALAVGAALLFRQLERWERR